MKRVLLVFVILFCCSWIQNPRTQAQPNPCWKLVCPHDPANGMFNPDSVYVDTCSTESTYRYIYAKRGLNILFKVGSQLIFSKFRPDTTVYLDYLNLDTTFSNYAVTLNRIDSLFGHFKLKKKYPECADTNLFASYLYLIEFDNYLDIERFDSTITSWYLNSNGIPILFMDYQFPSINGINPGWVMIIENKGFPYDENPDSIYWDINTMRRLNIPLDQFWNINSQIVRGWWRVVFNDTIPLLTPKDTFKLNDIDSSLNPTIYNYFKYLAKELGYFEITTDEKETYIHIFEYMNCRSYLFYPYHLFNGTLTVYFPRYRKGLPSMVKEPPTLLNQEIILGEIQANVLPMKYTHSKNSVLTITIYNSTAQNVLDIYSGNLDPGDHSYNVDISSLPAGVYFIVADYGTGRAIKKFVKE